MLKNFLCQRKSSVDDREVQHDTLIPLVAAPLSSVFLGPRSPAAPMHELGISISCWEWVGRPCFPDSDLTLKTQDSLSDSSCEARTGLKEAGFVHPPTTLPCRPSAGRGSIWKPHGANLSLYLLPVLHSQGEGQNQTP